MPAWSYACCPDGLVCTNRGPVPTCQPDPYPYVPPYLQRPNLTAAVGAALVDASALADSAISTAYPSAAALGMRDIASNAMFTLPTIAYNLLNEVEGLVRTHAFPLDGRVNTHTTQVQAWGM